MKTKIFVLALLAGLVLSFTVYAQTAEEWVEKGDSLDKLMKYNEALIYYDKAIRKDSTYIDSLLYHGLFLYSLGKQDEALKCYDIILDIDSDNLMAFILSGNILVELKKFDEALKCYDKVLEIKPNDYDSFYNKARILAKLKKKKEWLWNLKEAINIYKEVNQNFNYYQNRAKKDEAFKEYWDDPDFIELTKDTTKAE